MKLYRVYMNNRLIKTTYNENVALALKKQYGTRLIKIVETK